MGKERMPAFVRDTEMCDLKESPTGWGSRSHCDALKLILAIHGFLMAKFNEENSEEHSNLVSQQ